MKYRGFSINIEKFQTSTDADGRATTDGLSLSVGVNMEQFTASALGLTT